MSETSPVAPRMPRLARQWGPFLLLGVLSLAVVALDKQVKDTALRGYRLAEPAWTLESDDFPQHWRAWEQSAEYALIQEAAPPFMSEIAVAVRKATGVRPTPHRLALWLGRSGVFSGTEEGWVLSCRPGVALRLACFVHQWGAATPAEAVFEWGEIAYAWRDGFLLAGSTASLVQALAESGTPVSRGGHGAEGLSFAWDGERGARLTLSTETGLPFRLAVGEAATPTDGTLHYTSVWPDAMLVLNAVDESAMAALQEAGRALVPWVVPGKKETPWEAYVQAWWEGQVPPLPPRDSGGERALVVYPSQDSGDARGLDVGQVTTQCARPSEATLATWETARPYPWEGQSGWLLSTARHGRVRAVARVGETLFWANEPTRMPSLLDPGNQEAREGQLYLRAEWKPVMQKVRNWMLELAGQELLPGYHVGDIQRDWVPYMDGLATWSRLEAMGHVVDGQLILEGQLTYPEAG